MSKCEVRANVEATFDFVVEADSAEGAEAAVGQYLKYVQGGDADGQAISFKVKDGDKFTHCFFMDVDMPGINEA